MTRRAHIIDIDHLVLEGTGGLAPGALEAAIGAEVSRALRTGVASAPGVVARVPAIATRVASQVAGATRSTGRRVTPP
jgi:hypothetical protein